MAESIRQYRGKKSRDQAAEAAGVSAADFAKLEAGEIPEREAYRRICDWWAGKRRAL